MKIFYLTSRVPFPIDKGDKLRAYHQLRLLKKSNEIFLFCLNDERKLNINQDEIGKISHYFHVERLNKSKIVFNMAGKVFTEIPLQTAYFYSSEIKANILKTINEFKPDVIVCQLVRMANYLTEVKEFPIVIDYIDVLSKGLERRASNSNIILRPVFNTEFKRVLHYERKVFEDFKNGIIITKNDRDALPIHDKNDLKILPNGIDTDFFKPSSTIKDIDIIFAGNMAYPPNVDAVEFFVRKVMPILQITTPNLKFSIVGSSPLKKIKKLSSKNITVTGWVNDIRDYYNRAKLFIAPMQIGTGLQNKILEAMSMSLPCIISSLAHGGIQAENNKNVFVADDPVKYAELIHKLLNEDELRNRVGKSAREFVSSYYDWNAIIFDMEKYLEEVVRKFNN